MRVVVLCAVATGPAWRLQDRQPPLPSYLNAKRDIPLPAFLARCLAMDADPVTIFDTAQKSLEKD